MDEDGHGPMEAAGHQCRCGPALAMTLEVPQIQFLRRWVPVLRFGGYGTCGSLTSC